MWEEGREKKVRKKEMRCTVANMKTNNGKEKKKGNI
jgi:hypothetical protein